MRKYVKITFLQGIKLKLLIWNDFWKMNWFYALLSRKRNSRPGRAMWTNFHETGSLGGEIDHKRGGTALYSVSSSTGSDAARLFAKRSSKSREFSEIVQARAHIKTKSACTRLPAASAYVRHCQEIPCIETLINATLLRGYSIITHRTCGCQTINLWIILNSLW